MSSDDAELARSILSCPTTVELVVDGLPHAGDDRSLALLDAEGTPTFTCLDSSPMARAGADRRHALVTLASGLGPVGGPDRDSRVSLTGRLRSTGVESCSCCSEVRHTVTLGLEAVLLTRAGANRPVFPRPVPLDDFHDARLGLNRGSLQRAGEHATRCHQDELREAVAQRTDRPVREIAGVGLNSVTRSGIEMSWVDGDGAHRLALPFPQRATTLVHLGEMLRQQLHAGSC